LQRVRSAGRKAGPRTRILFAAKEDVRRFESEVARVEICPIAENHDGHLVRRETVNDRAKPHAAAGVPHARVALVGIEKPSESVGDRLAGGQVVPIRREGPIRLRSIRKLDRSQSRDRLFLAQQHVFLQRLIPLRQVRQVGIHTAIALSRGSRTLVGLHKTARLPLHPPTLIPYITYVPFIVLSAAFGGFRPGVLTTGLCFLESLYFATEPTASFIPRDPRNWFGLGSLLFTGLVTCLLFEGAKRAITDASARELADGQARVVEAARDIRESQRLQQTQDQVAREHELRRQTLESIIQNSPACIALLRGPHFTYESVNPAYQALIPGEPMVGRTVREVWPEAAPLVFPLLNVVREAQTVYPATEAIIPRHTPQGPVEARYFDVSFMPLPGLGGDDVQVLKVAIEVTRYKRAEEQLRAVNQELESALTQRTVLLKEVHHRVKNNLAVISSLLSMKADAVGITEAREALEESQRRVLSIALIHEQLYGSENLDRINFFEYTQQLVEQLHSSFISEPERIAIRLDIAPIEMGVHRAVPCALILNELVSNAFKHAFPGQRRGEVLVSLRESAPGYLEFVVEDNGIGSPPGVAERNTRSLGLEIVSILSRQLEGSFERQSATGAGTRLVLRFPVGTSRRAA